MASRTRKVTIDIVAEDKTKSAFQGVSKHAKATEQDLQRAGKSGGEGFTDKLKDGLGGAGGALAGLGKGVAVAGAAMGVAMGAALIGGLQKAMANDQARDKLTAQLGLSSVEAERVGGVAGELYSQAFGENLGEVNEAVRRVILNIDGMREASATDLEAVSAQVLTLADVFDQDLAMATQAVGAMMRNGLAPDAEHALDVLTRGMQLGADKADDLLETFQEYSSMFRDLGLSATDATGLMVQGLQAGARDADKVGDALKEIAIRGQDNSELSRKAFADLGLGADEMSRKFAEGGAAARDGLDKVLDGLRNIEDPVKRNEVAVALFGTQAEDLGDALFALDLDTAAQGLGTVAGAADGAASAYDNAATKIESFKRRALEVFTNYLSSAVIPGVERFAEVVGPSLREALGSTETSGKTSMQVLSEATIRAFESMAVFTRDTLIPAFVKLHAWWDANGPAISAVVNAVWSVVKIAWNGIVSSTALMRAVMGPIIQGIGNGIYGLAIIAAQTVNAIAAALPGVKPPLGNMVNDLRGARDQWNASFKTMEKHLRPSADTSQIRIEIGNLSSWAAKQSIRIPFKGAMGDGFGAPLPGRGGSALATVQRQMQGLPGLRITSTYRSPARNRAAGGAARSYHMDASNPAVDVGGPASSLDRLYARLRPLGARELLWRTKGHYDHLHYAHGGGMVLPSWPTVPGLRADERPAVLQVGETVTPRGGGGGTSITIDMRGAVVADERQFRSMVTRALEQAGRSGVPVTVRGRAV